MAGYNEYIGKLKGVKAKLDAQRMLKMIEGRVASEKRTRSAGIAAASLIAVLIGLSLYFYVIPYYFGGGTSIADYVYQQSAANGDQIMNYVYSDS